MTDPSPTHVDPSLNGAALETAIDAQRRAVANAPADYDAGMTLSRLLYRFGRYAEAVSALSAAQKHDPLLGDYRAVEAAMQARTFGRAGGIALSMNQTIPGHPGAALALSHLYQMQGNPKARLVTVQAALRYCPADATLRALLIGAYEDCGDYCGAIEAASELIRFKPEFDTVIGGMRIFLLYGENEAVLNMADQAYALCGKNAALRSEVDLLRGHALKTLARREDAIAAYRACIANKPQNGTGWWSLADMKNYAFTDDDRGAIKAVIASQDAPDEQKSQALFALAKSYDIAGDPVRGMEAYLKANATHPGTPFQPEPFASAVTAITRAFDETNLSVTANPAREQATPIFILGMPRSGSTLIEQILASHSQIEGTIEIPSLPTVKRLVHAECNDRFGAGYLQTVHKLSSNSLSEFGQAYLKSSAFFRTEDTPFYTDKLPYNFEHVGLIRKLLPHAKIIDARRNPLDCGLSIFRQHFGLGANFSYDLSHIGAYYNGYLSLMDHWDAKLSCSIIRVQYEDMVRDTETEIRKLLAALGLEFEQACLHFYKNKRAVRTASSEQVRRPITTGSIGMWKAVEAQLSPLKESLGLKTLARFAQYTDLP